VSAQRAELLTIAAVFGKCHGDLRGLLKRLSSDRMGIEAIVPDGAAESRDHRNQVLELYREHDSKPCG
jgi:hypothetical protein